MYSLNHISGLLRDFIFRDCRAVDIPWMRFSVFIPDGDILKLVATSRDASISLPNITYRVGESLIGDVFAKKSMFVVWNIPPDYAKYFDPRIHTDKGIKPIVACSIVVNGRSVGVLSLESRSVLRFSSNELLRIQVLSMLVAYEIFFIQQQSTNLLLLSAELPYVLRSVRDELRITQEDLASLMGTSRISLSQLESGAQSPTLRQLRRWAVALGLLAGGRSQIITFVDATPQLIEVLRDNPQLLSQLSPEQFELVVAECLDRMGYAIQRTGDTNFKDGGIDIIAVPKTSDTMGFLLGVQVKHHRGNRPTVREDVDRLLAWQNTVFRLGMLVTNTRFTKDALWTAAQYPSRNFIRLRDFADLRRWLQGVFQSELEWREIPDSIDLAPGVTVSVPKPKFTKAGIVWPFNSASDEDFKK